LIISLVVLAHEFLLMYNVYVSFLLDLCKNPFAEPAELRYFITQVKDKMDRGALSPTNGQTLIDSANGSVAKIILLPF
jgi:hypothetical protein